jgi:drug/metabolite transporter (DMT)-like permease
MKSNILLIITAMIWGFAFVAQRSGMEYVGPFTFNSIRFSLGALSLLPILILNQRKSFNKKNLIDIRTNRFLLKGGIIAGIILFFGASFQQGGMVFTEAGKAGFITGLYIVLVPVIGLAFKQRTSGGTWLGAIVAFAGLYLLSVKPNLTMELGDLLVLISAIFWSLHVLTIGRFSPRTDPIQLAFFQFLLCAILSLFTALFKEVITLSSILYAAVPILYAGLVSVGIAYTLQVVAQRDAHPSHAAIIMSLESVFAVIGGWLILNESISLTGLAGCALMLTGMILSQFSLTNKFIKLKQG